MKDESLHHRIEKDKAEARLQHLRKQYPQTYLKMDETKGLLSIIHRCNYHIRDYDRNKRMGKKY